MGEHSKPEPTEGTDMNLLGREPAQWIGLLSAAVALFSSIVLPVSLETQGAIIAVATAAFGIVGALAVSGEKAAPLVAGFVQSVLALALSLGLHLDNATQGSIMAFVAAGVAWYLRTQVFAPVPAAVTDGKTATA
jgi:hypothetical protein